jgi:hypothetical protein
MKNSLAIWSMIYMDLSREDGKCNRKKLINKEMQINMITPEAWATYF